MALNRRPFSKYLSHHFCSTLHVLSAAIFKWANEETRPVQGDAAAIIYYLVLEECKIV